MSAPGWGDQCLTEDKVAVAVDPGEHACSADPQDVLHMLKAHVHQMQTCSYMQLN